MSAKIPTYKSPNRRRMEREIRSLELRANMLRSRLANTDEPPGLDKLILAVGIHTGFPGEELLKLNRRHDHVDARCIFMHIAVNVYGYSKRQVAIYLKLNNSTIHYNLHSYQDKVFNEPFRRLASAVEHNVRLQLNRQPSSRQSIAQ